MLSRHVWGWLIGSKIGAREPSVPCEQTKKSEKVTSPVHCGEAYYGSPRKKPAARRAVNLHPPRARPQSRRRKNTVKIPGSRWTAERSPECASLPLLCRTSTSIGACGWPTGCLVLSSVRELQMNVCWINGTRSLVERSHECPRRSDQTISMRALHPYRVWMGLSPSIELNNANGKSVHMPRRIAQSSNG